MATREPDNADPSEPQPRSRDLAAVRQKLTALQMDSSVRRSRLPKWLLVMGFLSTIGVLFLAYFPTRAGSWRGRTRVAVETVAPRLESTSAGPAGTPLLTASGYVVARRHAVISAKIQGVLSELNVDIGQTVAQGQIIARLKSTEYDARIANSKAAIQVAQATLEESRRQLRIAEELERAHVVSKDQKDAARSRFDSAQASLLLAQADLHTQETLKEDTVIRAPFSGTVVKKMAEIGESVSPIPPGVNISISSGAIVALADLGHLDVEVDISESNIASLEPRMPAEVKVQAFPDRKYKGALRQLVPTADRTKGTVQAKVTILDADGNLKPEMTAQVTFLYPAVLAAKGNPGVAVLNVPQQAVVTRGESTLVFEVVDGTVREHSVVVAGKQGDVVKISRGLTGQEALVLAPPAGMREGDPVRTK